MTVLYVREQGSCVQKRGERIVVTKNRKELLDIPVMGVENIALIGNVQMTTQMLHYLMEQGVDVSYFSFGGSYLGHSAAESSRNIFVRFAQYELYLNMPERISMAKTIVRNKIENQRALILQYRWTGSAYDWKKDVAQMEKLQEKLAEVDTPNQVLGIEGMCSSIYFKSFAQMFRCKITFPGRNRRPPKDPINVILSLGYTFLTREVSTALEAESFEMYLGFLHGIRYGRKSLALDMVEEFRQPVVDRLVIRLFNKQIFSEYDFDTEEESIALNEEGFRKFCREYEKWLTDKTFSDSSKSFRSAIKEQAAMLKRSIQHKEPYVPFSWVVAKKTEGEETQELHFFEEEYDAE